MKGKLPALFIALLVISPLYQPCTAQFIQAVGFASSVPTLEQFIGVMCGKVFKDSQKGDEVLLSVDKMNNDVNYQLEEITKSLGELPSIIDHTNKHNKLQDHVNNIGSVFKRVVRMQKDIDNGSREDISTYINFRKELEHTIDKDIDEIQRMLLDSTTTSYLTTTFTEGLRVRSALMQGNSPLYSLFFYFPISVYFFTFFQLYENVCKSGMTHMHLLDSILAKLKLATAEYYIIKNKMYDFVQANSKLKKFMSIN